MYTNVILEYIQKGGYYFMIPLIIMSIISLAVILERIYFLWRSCSISDNQYQILKRLLNENNLNEVSKITSVIQTLPCTIITNAISMVNNNPDKITIQESLQKSADRHIGWLSKRFWLLKTIAHLSPILGLLGTVVGLAVSFGNIAESGLDQKSVASGISMALITTITGLVIALPTLFSESLLRAWAKKKHEEISALLDDLSIWCKR